MCFIRRPPNDNPDAIEFCFLGKLIAASDVIALHVLIITETEMLFFSTERLWSNEKGAILINTARGQLVDEQALLEALRDEHLGGAGIDVFAFELPRSDPRWSNLKNVILTPHIAFNSREAIKRKLDLCVSNVESFVTGTLKN